MRVIMDSQIAPQKCGEFCQILRTQKRACDYG